MLESMYQQSKGLNARTPGKDWTSLEASDTSEKLQ